MQQVDLLSTYTYTFKNKICNSNDISVVFFANSKTGLLFSVDIANVDMNSMYICLPSQHLVITTVPISRGYHENVNNIQELSLFSLS